MDLSVYSTDALLEELARRTRAPEAEDIVHWCDDCNHFTPKAAADDDYNPCAKAHRMHFHAPQDMGEAAGGYFGYYRRRCRDRDETRVR